MCRRCNGTREVAPWGNRSRETLQAAAGHILPEDDVSHQLRYAVAPWERASQRLFRRNAGQSGTQGGSVPGGAEEGRPAMLLQRLFG